MYFAIYAGKNVKVKMLIVTILICTLALLCLPRLVQRNPKAHSRNCINREEEICYGGKAHEEERNTLHANLKIFNHRVFLSQSGRCLKPLNVAKLLMHCIKHYIRKPNVQLQGNYILGRVIIF